LAYHLRRNTINWFRLKLIWPEGKQAIIIYLASVSGDLAWEAAQIARFSHKSPEGWRTEDSNDSSFEPKTHPTTTMTTNRTTRLLVLLVVIA